MVRTSSTLTQKFQMLTGTMGRTKIEGRMRGSKIEFSAGTTKYTGTVNGNSISGKTSTGQSLDSDKVTLPLAYWLLS